MATKIVTKNSSTASAVPTASDLVQGELAVNVADKRLFTEDNGGSIVELGTNPSGNVTFQDNGKAIFGAGSDLQIYHDGSASFISDQGTGHLKLLAGDFRLNSAADDSQMISAVSGAEVNVFHNNALKLSTTATGIDVTGSVTADGLNVQNGSNAGITFDLTTNYSPVIKGSQAVSDLYLAAVGGGGINLSTTDKSRVLIQNNGDISFYEDTGTTAKFFWDASAESLGIGTSSPSAFLSFGANIPSNGQTLHTYQSGNTRSGLGIVSGVHRLFTDSESALSFGQVSTSDGSTYAEAMRIDSSGNVLVGTTDATLWNDNADNYGHNILDHGQYYSSTNGEINAYLNRQNSDGAILAFAKDGSPVGSIGTYTGYTRLGGNTNSGFIFRSGQILPWNNSTSDYADGTQDLGTGAGARFKDLHLSGGVYLGGTGAANKLDAYEEGTWTPTGFSGGTLYNARYTKVGRLVTVSAYVNGTTFTSASMGGLPFTSEQGWSAGTLGLNDSTNINNCEVASSSTNIQFRQGATSVTPNGSGLMVSATYHAA